MSSISLPGFEVLDTLRQTSKTVTVKAVQRSLERTVALTFLRPELAPNANEARRFLDIARVCAQIKADGLPQIYDITSHGDQPYIVMEYVEGLSLAEIVRQNGPLPIVLSVRVAITVADALDHAWKQNRLVHRNLKPSEIRIDGRGTPKLTDFGRATVILSDGHMADEEEPGTVVGTPNFLSPEQVRGSAVIDCRADIYALGATLYYMITGRVPFPDSDPETVIQKQLTDQIPHPRTFRPEVTASVSGLLARLMMKVADDRYADWTEAMGDMQLALKNLPLRRREKPQKGISTISSVVASNEAAPPPELPQLRKLDIRSTVAIPSIDFPTIAPTNAPTTMLRPPATTALTPITAPPPAAPPPAAATPPVAEKKSTPDSGLSHLLHITLWLLLGIWFVLLGNDRLNNPLNLPLPSPLLPLDAWFGTAPKAASPVSLPAVVDNRTPVTPVASPVVPPPPPTPPTPPAAEQPAVATVTPSAPPAVKPAEAEKTPPPSQKLAQTLPSDVIKRLAEAFVRNDLAAARAVLAENISIDPTRLTEYRSAIEAIPNPLRLAEQTIEASKGQELTITYMGKERKIIPRTIAPDAIEADFVTADGNRPVTLKTAKFTADELLTLLPPHPETPPVHAAVCLALLKASHKADIAAHIAYCGVLGPIFEAAAASLPAPSTQTP